MAMLLYWIIEKVDGKEARVRVLLVEDETRLAETVRRGLAAEGFVVDVEHDGADGLAGRRHRRLRRGGARHHAARAAAAIRSCGSCGPARCGRRC